MNYPNDAWAEPILLSDSAWLGKHTFTTQNQSNEVISFARKLYTRTNDYYGLLIINTDVKYWEEVMASKNHNSMRTLLDSGGRPLLHLGQDDEAPVIVSDFTLIPEQESGYMKTTINQKSYLMVWSRSPDSKWGLIEFTAWDKIASGSSKIRTTIWWIGFVSMFVILFIIRLFVNQFTRPIMHLVRLMNKYPNHKDLGIIPNDYRNEFGHLFQGYRKLVNRIESLYNDLELQYTMQKEVEVKALQAMINPHFLYNTLDQINWAAIESNQNDVSEMISLLGRMLRITLSHGKGLITLQQELELVQCYLELQKIRWKDRLTVNIDVPEPLYNYVIPKVTIQPFIENAFRHGFHGKEKAELTLQAYEEKGQLYIVIEDDGRGLRKGWQESSDNSFGGYALNNVKERVQTYFGERYGFELNNLVTGGVRAVIHLPIVHQLNQSDRK
ncbi:Sensor histidine kinase YehU [compost metagenome]